MVKLTLNQRCVLSALLNSKEPLSASDLHSSLGLIGMSRSSVQSALLGLQSRGYAGVISAGSPMKYVGLPAGRAALEAKEG